MYRRGRPIDPIFEPAEWLYHRCKLEEVDGDRLLPTAISFRNWSVNRGKYSEPEDVLIPDWKDWGIAKFRAEHVPGPMNTAGDTVWEFKIEHDPLEDNYSHSEIRSYKNGALAPKPQPSDLIKKAFRQIISDNSAIHRQPRV